MKIVQLVFHLGPGGAEKFVTDLSNELAARGHDVLVLMLRDRTRPEYAFNLPFLSEQVRVRSLGLPTGFHPGQIRQVCHVLDEEKPEVVHGHLGVMPFIYAYSLKHKEIRFIHTLHSIPTFDTRHPLFRRLASFFYRRSITPVVISPICAKLFRETYGFDATLIGNGRALPPESGAYAQVRQEAAKMQRPVFVHVARCAPEKNQAMLLDAFRQLEEEGTAFTLLVIGSGFDRPEWSSRADDRIRFLGARDNVCDYLRQADAFCLTSLVEGSPISLIEALACGVTPVCTPAGGIPDIISDGQTGYLSRGFDTGSYLEALRAFLQRPIPRENLILRYVSEFTMPVCAARYLNLYNTRRK